MNRRKACRAKASQAFIRGFESRHPPQRKQRQRKPSVAVFRFGQVRRAVVKQPVEREAFGARSVGFDGLLRALCNREPRPCAAGIGHGEAR